MQVPQTKQESSDDDFGDFEDSKPDTDTNMQSISSAQNKADVINDAFAEMFSPRKVDKVVDEPVQSTSDMLADAFSVPAENTNPHNM